MHAAAAILPRIRRLLVGAARVLPLVAMLGVFGPACQREAGSDTSLFRLAEDQLHRGDYDEATRNYEDFLERYPASPLVPIARQRLRNIDRELEAVMGRRSMPAPIYIRPPDPGEEPNPTSTAERRWGRSGP